MYRRSLSFSAMFIAVLAAVSCTTSIAIAQDDDVPTEGAPAGAPGGPRPGGPRPGGPAGEAGSQARDYSKIQAAGVLATAGPVTAVSFSPNGRMLAAVTIQQVHLWDTATGTPLKPLTFPQGFVRALAWSSDGAFLATGGGGQGEAIKLWDVQTGTAVREFGGRTFVSAMALFPDRSVVATTGFDKKIRIWNVATGQELRVLEGPQFPISSLEFAPDGKALYCLGGGTGKLLEAEGGDGGGDGGGMPMGFPGMQAPGKYESMTEFIAWSTVDGSVIQHVTLTEGSPNVALSPDKSLLVVTGSHALVRAGGGGGGEGMRPGARFQTVWPTDTVRLWRVPASNAGNAADPATAFLPEVLKLPNPTPKDKVGVAWSPDNKVRVIDNFLWDGGATPTPLPGGNLGQYTSFAFSPDGRFLAGGTAKGVQIWVVP